MSVLDVAAEPLATGGVKYHAIEYGSVEGFRPLQLDLYLPRDAGVPAPSIVYFHGGGWAVGTRRRFGRSFKSWSPTPLARLAAAGFAVATVDYRLSNEARFPAQLDDAKAAVRWLRGHAAELSLDPDRIVAWGESAGAHVAALVGVTGSRDNGDDVCGVIDWYGPMDLTQGDDADSPESKLLGGTAIANVELARAASPALLVHPGAPRFHIQHGTRDSLVAIGQSEQLAGALDEVGVPVQFIGIEGAEHFWTNAPDLEAIFMASLDFARMVTAC